MAMHTSLIPKGPHQGHLLVWDAFPYTGVPAGQTRVHRWAIVDPVNQLFWNFNMLLPTGMGDLFCAGHAWTRDGDLLVVGGTGCHGAQQTQPPCNGWEGSQLAYLWRPPTAYGGGGVWTPIPNLDNPRWYPSGLAFDSDPNSSPVDPVGVLGGTHLGTPQNSYQQWLPAGALGAWKPKNATSNSFQGPTGQAALDDYPRAHWVAGQPSAAQTPGFATAGMPQQSTRVDPHTAPETWHATWNQTSARFYGSSILFPISPRGAPYKDLVLALGGKTDRNPLSGTILATVGLCNAGAASPSWVSLAPLTYPRWFLNTVALPDGSILAIGGEQTYRDWSCSVTPAYVPELYIFGAWLQMALGTIIRDYHSAAVLLPNAKVVLTGGESRHFGPSPNCPTRTTTTVFPADYQLFVPHYIQCGWTRPVIRNQAAPGGYWIWNRSGMYDVEYDWLSAGLSIAKAVLIRPGSATHHSDGNQRCVELEFTGNVPVPEGYPSIKVTLPAQASRYLPRGIYMLFLVTNQGAPSVAAWVQVTA